MSAFFDRISETFTTTGTGAVTVGGARTRFKTIASRFIDGDVKPFLLEDPNTGDWEVSMCTLSSTRTVLTRTTVLASSNSDAAVSFASGSKYATHVMPAVQVPPYIGTTAPSNPYDGRLWWKSDEGSLKIYYNDGNTSQWIDASGSGSLGGMVKIAKVITTGSATTITFASIPQTYTDLKLIFQGRDTNSGAVVYTMRLKINSDATSGNYTNSQWTDAGDAVVGSGSSAPSAAGMWAAYVAGQSGLATAVGQFEWTIANYAGTTFYKTVAARNTVYYNGTTSKADVLHWDATWKSTAAITDLVISSNGTAFVDGSTATLYGLG